MKLFLYYAFCSVKNQIRKLFKSWVAIFLAVCLLFGVLLGIGIGVVDSFLGEDVPEEEIETVVPEEEPEPLDPETAVAVAEMISFGVVLAVLFFSVITADKNGSFIFLMADVNLLFSAPMKPQSVLLFRLMSQIFLTLFASIYLLFQLPNLIVNLGMDAMTVIAIMAVWVMTLVYGKLLNILIYTIYLIKIQFMSQSKSDLGDLIDRLKWNNGAISFNIVIYHVLCKAVLVTSRI